MKKIMETWIIVLFGILIIIECWNCYSLWRLKKLSKTSKKDIRKEHYFDLKYQIKLFAAIGSLAVFAIVFFQWDTKDGLEKEYIENFKIVKDSIESLKSNVTKASTDFNHSFTQRKEDLNQMQSDVKKLLEEKEYYEKSISGIKKNIKRLDETVQKNPRFHVFIDKEVIRKSGSISDTIFFKNCINDVLGNKVREFKVPPIVTFFNFKYPFYYGNNVNAIGFLPPSIMTTTKDYIVFMLINGGLIETNTSYSISFSIMDLSETNLNIE